MEQKVEVLTVNIWSVSLHAHAHTHTHTQEPGKLQSIGSQRVRHN